jgi:hypothetical protein
MSDTNTVEGACLCGAVRFEVTLPTMFCGHCHCTMCQRNHGAAFVTWLAVDRSQLELTDGGSELIRYESSEHGARSFCPRCGTSLFCENDAHPDRVDIPLANMNGPIDRAPQVHVHVDSQADWHAIVDSLPRLGGKTGLEPK